MDHFKKHPILTGTLLLTFTSILSRAIGFFYRIFLSRTIGAEGMGIYQLIFPVYALFSAVSSSGIQTGISRCCGKAFAGNDPCRAKSYFYGGLFLSLLLSVPGAWFLYTHASFTALFFLKEERCTPLLKVIALSLPFGSLHSCISAWYYARGKAGMPSFSQLLEQLTRVGASFLIYAVLLENHRIPTAMTAALGILAGELAGSLFSLAALSLQFHSSRYNEVRAVNPHPPLSCLKELFFLTLPLTGNKVLLTLFLSVEAALIPAQLRIYGFTSSQALAAYGILTGMSLPFILFPSALTGSLSTMVLPAIAGDQAAGNDLKIREKIEHILQYCLLLGILAAGIFFFYGESLGQIFYNNADAGAFLSILSLLCPFLYLSTTLTSILNGLGHTALCLVLNLSGILIRLSFILFLVPRMGLSAYIAGLIVSHLVITFLTMYLLSSMVPYRFDPGKWIFLPFAAVLTGSGWGLLLCRILLSRGCSFSIASLLALLLTGSIYLLFLHNQLKF